MVGIKGIIEISSFGGYFKQYEVVLNLVILQGYDIVISEVFDVFVCNN